MNTLIARHATDAVRVTTTDDRGSWSACSTVGFSHVATIAAQCDSELDALTSLAIALGLDADGSDPRAEVERLLMDAKDASVRLSEVCAELDGTIAERDAALADAEALRLAARAYFVTIDNAPPFGAGDLALREHDAACDKTAHTLAVLAGARGPR